MSGLLSFKVSYHVGFFALKYLLKLLVSPHCHEWEIMTTKAGIPFPDITSNQLHFELVMAAMG